MIDFKWEVRQLADAGTPEEKIETLIAVKRKLLEVKNTSPPGTTKRLQANRLIREIDSKLKSLMYGTPKRIMTPTVPAVDQMKPVRPRGNNDEEDVLSLIDVIEPGKLSASYTLGNVQLSEDEKEALKKNVIWPLKDRDRMEANGFLPGSYLVFGPAGTGKTTLVQAVANDAEATLVLVDGASIKGRFYGQSSARMTRILKYVNTLAEEYPVILLIEEGDALLGKTGHGAGRDIIASFLTGMDGVGRTMDRRRFSCFVTTNRPEAFEGNVVRRMGNMLYLGPPNRDQRYNFLRTHLLELHDVAPDIDIKSLASDTRGYTCADLKRLLDLANRERLDIRISPPRMNTLRNEHLTRAKARCTSTLTDETLKLYQRFASDRKIKIPDYD